MGMFDYVTVSKNVFKPNELIDKYNIDLDYIHFQTKDIEGKMCRHFRIQRINNQLVLCIEITKKNEIIDENFFINEPPGHKNYGYFNECDLPLTERLYKKCDSSEKKVQINADLMWDDHKVKMICSNYTEPTTGEIYINFAFKKGIISHIRGFIDIVDREKDIHERSIIIPRVHDLEWLAPFQYL
jgi:hypothetical protein